MYAGGDMVLIPSLFEPCGLTQLFGRVYFFNNLCKRKKFIGTIYSILLKKISLFYTDFLTKLITIVEACSSI